MPSVLVGPCNPDGTRTVNLDAAITPGADTEWELIGFLGGTTGHPPDNPRSENCPPGSYVAKLHFIDPPNCPTVPVPVTVDPCPPPDCPKVINLTVTVSGCADGVNAATATFSGTLNPAQTGCSFQWNFGDGNVQTTSTPATTHPYLNPGTYSANVNAICPGGCVQSTTILVTIPACCPTVTAVNWTVEGCADGKGKSANVTCVATTNPPAAQGNYTWDFGDGSPQQPNSPSTVQHAYNSPGSYTVNVVFTPLQMGCPPSSASTIVRPPRCTDGGGGGGACCGETIALIAAALIALGVAAFIGILSLTYCLGVPVPPWLWYFAVGLVIAGLVVILICYILCALPFLDCVCPTACDWLLIAWYSFLVADLVALWLVGCCGGWWWGMILAFTVVFLLTFGQWIRQCKPTLCNTYIDLIGAVTLGGVTIVAYFALIPALKQCGSTLVGSLVALALLVLAALANSSCTQKT